MSKISMPTMFVVIVSITVSIAPAHGQVILYVDKDAPPGGDGFSWETAFDDLATVVVAAEPSVDRVLSMSNGGRK